MSARLVYFEKVHDLLPITRQVAYNSKNLGRINWLQREGPDHGLVVRGLWIDPDRLKAWARFNGKMLSSALLAALDSEAVEVLEGQG